MSKAYPEIIKALPRFAGPFDAYQLSAEDCDVLFACYPAGTVIEAHSHETENVGIITEGELILTMDGETRRYPAGNWYHIPANREHAAKFDVATQEIEFWFKNT